MEQFLDRCRRRVGMAVTPAISPEVFEVVRWHLEVALPTFLVESYLHASQFILQILCPPPNASISPHLEEAISFIVREVCELENATSEQQAVTTESLRYVFEALPGSSLVAPPSMGPEEQQCPDKYGLYLFHLIATLNGITDAYRRYALPCLHAIYDQIALETSASIPLRSSRGRSLAYDYSLSLRYFLTYAVVRQRSQVEPITRNPSADEIDEAFELLARDPKYALDRTTIALHKKRVMVAFGYDTQRFLGPRSQSNRQGSTGHGQADVLFRSKLIPPGEDPWDDPDHTVAHETHYAMPRDAFDERECPDEYATSNITIPPEIEGNTIAASIYKRTQAAATAIAQSKRYFWDRATLPLYAYLHLLVHSNPLDPEFALAWLIGQTGQDPARLADLRFVNGTCPQHGLGLHFDSRSLFYRQPDDWHGWEYSSHAALLRDCLRSTDEIVLRLPQPAWSVLAPYLDRRRAIQDKLPEELRSLVFLSLESPYSPISVEALDKYLRSLSNSSFPFRITAASLAQSFWFYGGRFGREDLILPYLAGRVPRALKSQMFYIRMTLDRINQDYEQFVHAFIQALLTEANALDEGTDSSTLTQTLMRLFPALFDTSQTLTPPPSMISNIAVGSEAVPRRDRLQAFLSVATDVLHNLSSDGDPCAQRRYSNLFMILTRFQYSLGTGLRPVGDSRLSLNNVMIRGESSYAMIGEKANGRFADMGLIKHSPTVHRVCMSALDAGTAILSLLRPTSPSILDDYAAMGQPTFFLIDDQGQLALMRPSLVRAELSALRLSDVLIAPLNAPRHYLLTYLFDQRVARPLRDKIARHQHEGYEWFSLLSGTDTDEADEILCGVIEIMLNDLGIRPMQFKRWMTP